MDKKGVFLTVLVILSTVGVGHAVLQEQSAAIEDLAEEKCSEKFGPGNWTWIEDGTGPPYFHSFHIPAKCKNEDTGEIYEPEIVLKGSK